MIYGVLVFWSRTGYMYKILFGLGFLWLVRVRQGVKIQPNYGLIKSNVTTTTEELGAKTA